MIVEYYKRLLVVSVTRVPWNSEEVEEIEEYFKDFLDPDCQKKCPRMKDYIYAISVSKVKACWQNAIGKRWRKRSTAWW